VFAEPLFGSDDDNELEEVENLHDLDLLMPSGHEIQIYDERGFRILRRKPLDDQAITTYGPWIRLLNAHNLFHHRHDPTNAPHRMDFAAYPQAFLKEYGNIQSTSIPTSFKPCLSQINSKIRRPLHGDGDSDDEDDRLETFSNAPAISAVSFQSYNEISHRFRDEAKFHSVQLGLITAALSGSGSTGHQQRCWSRKFQHCKERLPHLRFDDKIAGGDQPESLRNEITYTLHLNRVSPNYRNGA
jgi:hypothetical protein